MRIEIQQLLYEARSRGSKVSTDEGRLIVTGRPAPALYAHDKPRHNILYSRAH